MGDAWCVYIPSGDIAVSDGQGDADSISWLWSSLSSSSTTPSSHRLSSLQGLAGILRPAGCNNTLSGKTRGLTRGLAGLPRGCRLSGMTRGLLGLTRGLPGLPRGCRLLGVVTSQTGVPAIRAAIENADALLLSCCLGRVGVSASRSMAVHTGITRISVLCVRSGDVLLVYCTGHCHRLMTD